MALERTDIEGEAAFWIEQMSRPVQDSAVAAAFDSWILADSRNVESYARMLAVWQSDGARQALTLCAAPDNHAPGEHRNRQARKATGRWSDRSVATFARSVRPRYIMGMAAGALALALAIPAGQGLLAPEIAYAAQDGHNRVLDLADGSQVHLRGGSRIAIRLTPWSRTVRMVDGEAFFDVAHERFRRFSVTAGEATVEVLGTAFNVRLTRDGSREVDVYRGVVSVETGQSDQRLLAGEGLALTRAGMRFVDVADGRRPDWTDGWIDARNTSLALLVERMNHMSGRRIRFTDPSLGNLRVTGQFRADDQQEMLDAVSAIHGLSWRAYDGTYLLSRPTQQP